MWHSHAIKMGIILRHGRKKNNGRNLDKIKSSVRLCYPSVRVILCEEMLNLFESLSYWNSITSLILITILNNYSFFLLFLLWTLSLCLYLEILYLNLKNGHNSSVVTQVKEVNLELDRTIFLIGEKRYTWKMWGKLQRKITKTREAQWHLSTWIQW